eukprot:14453689-Alexandrium_andersonii.AAC.1
MELDKPSRGGCAAGELASRTEEQRMVLFRSTPHDSCAAQGGRRPYWCENDLRRPHGPFMRGATAAERERHGDDHFC